MRLFEVEVGEGIEPENLVFEDVAEVAGDGVNGVFYRWRGVEGALRIGLEIKAGDGSVADSAGDDEVEVAKIGGDVEGESVGGYPAGDVNTNRGNFLLLDGSAGEGPDAGASGDSLGEDAEVGRGANKGFFEPADVVDGTEARGEAAEVEDGIPDELTGAMVGDIASTIDFVNLDATAGEELI
jgi:hypothetical protein